MYFYSHSFCHSLGRGLSSHCLLLRRYNVVSIETSLRNVTLITIKSSFIVLQFDPEEEVNILMRASFSFAAITYIPPYEAIITAIDAFYSMIFGPFLVLTPLKPIVLKKETFFKKLVRGAQKKETCA